MTEREANLIERLLDCVEFIESLLGTGDMNEVHDFLINNGEDIVDLARETIREATQGEL